MYCMTSFRNYQNCTFFFFASKFRNIMASISIKPESPLKDDDLSELTKNEIVYWADKLRITPSEMFLLSNEELEEQLSMVRKPLKIGKPEKSLINQLGYTKNNLRLRADGKQIWSILIETAGKIQDVLSDENEPFKYNEEKKVVLRERMRGGMNSLPMNSSFVGCDCPNNPARLNWLKPYTNATEYTMSYSPRGTEERADSVSVEPIDAMSGIITVSTRIYSTPSPLPCLCPENPLNQRPGALQQSTGVPEITSCEPSPQVQYPSPQTPVQRRVVQRGRPRPQKTLAESMPERIRRRLAKRHACRPIPRKGPLFPPVSSSASILEDVTPPTGYEESIYDTAASELLESQTPASSFEQSVCPSGQGTFLQDTTAPSALNVAGYSSILEEESEPSGFDAFASMSPSTFNECASISTADTLLDNVSPPSDFNELTYDTTLAGVSPPSGFDECPSICPATSPLENVTQSSFFDGTAYSTLLEEEQDESEIEVEENPIPQNLSPSGACPVSYSNRVSPPPYTLPAQTRTEPNYNIQTPKRKMNLFDYRPRKLFSRSPGCPPLFSPRDENRMLSPEQYYSPVYRPRYARGRPKPRPLAAALPDHIRRRLQRPRNQRSPLRRKSVGPVCPTVSEGTLLEDESPPEDIGEMSFLPSVNSTLLEDVTAPSGIFDSFDEETGSEIGENVLSNATLPNACPTTQRYMGVPTTPKRPVDWDTCRPRKLQLSSSCPRPISPELEEIESTSPPSGFSLSQLSGEPTLQPSANASQVSRCPLNQTQIRTTPRRPVDWDTYRSRKLQLSSSCPRSISPELEQIASTSPPSGFSLSQLSGEPTLQPSANVSSVSRCPPGQAQIRTTPRRPVDWDTYRSRKLQLSSSCPRSISSELDEIESISPPSGFSLSQFSGESTLQPSANASPVSRCPLNQSQIRPTPSRPVDWDTYRPRRLQLPSGSSRTASCELEQLESTSPPFGFDSCPETSALMSQTSTALEDVTPPSGFYSSVLSDQTANLAARSPNNRQCPIDTLQYRLYSGECSLSSEDNSIEYWENAELTSSMPSPVKFGWSSSGESNSPISSPEWHPQSLNTSTYNSPTSFSKCQVLTSTPTPSPKSLPWHQGSFGTPPDPPRRLNWSKTSSSTLSDNLSWEASAENIVFDKFASPTNSDCSPALTEGGLEDYFLNL